MSGSETMLLINFSVYLEHNQWNAVFIAINYNLWYYFVAPDNYYWLVSSSRRQYFSYN